jgi:hypothetical protein
VSRSASSRHPYASFFRVSYFSGASGLLWCFAGLPSVSLVACRGFLQLHWRLPLAFVAAFSVAQVSCRVAFSLIGGSHKAWSRRPSVPQVPAFSFRVGCPQCRFRLPSGLRMACSPLPDAFFVTRGCSESSAVPGATHLHSSLSSSSSFLLLPLLAGLSLWGLMGGGSLWVGLIPQRVLGC